jgi:hypothetical protein
MASTVEHASVSGATVRGDHDDLNEYDYSEDMGYSGAAYVNGDDEDFVSLYSSNSNHLPKTYYDHHRKKSSVQKFQPVSTGLQVGNDPGNYRITRYVHGKPVNIEFFVTRFNPGTTIRNAVTGIREKNMLVGRKTEDIFFKVALSGVFADRDGCLFYNSPEEYERHFHTTVSQPMKSKWMERCMNYHSQEPVINPSESTEPNFVTIH